MSYKADLQDIITEFRSIQDSICTDLEAIDGKANFPEDLWERVEGGGGRTRVIANGKIFEKGAVNFSHVHGPMPEKIAVKLKQKPGSRFDACGVSLIMHPESPFNPIIHMNIRYFEMEGGTYWFGGGIDLTPIYIIPEQAKAFHQSLKFICDKYDAEWYSRFKDWCDKYFYLKNRNETRGVGGVFFDRLHEGSEALDKASIFSFVSELGRSFSSIYKAQLTDQKPLDQVSDPEHFQSLRRSRYVEFNLLYDLGTKFGLDTGGRTESILVSMPPQAEWVYRYEAPEGSAEAYTLDHLRAIDWIHYT